MVLATQPTYVGVKDKSKDYFIYFYFFYILLDLYVSSLDS